MNRFKSSIGRSAALVAVVLSSLAGSAALAQEQQAGSVANRPASVQDGASSAAALLAQSGSRAQVLYDTHCGHCHTQQVHWRERKLVTDWASLKSQVWRWQSNTGLGWRDDDVDAVARYLNARIYRFNAPPRS